MAWMAEVQAAPHRAAHAAARFVECLRCLTTPLNLPLIEYADSAESVAPAVTIPSGCRADCGIV
jgi:hypothetical protein